MKDHKDSVMIALIPIVSDWCKVDYPHLTLVYAGETQDLKAADRNALAKVANDLAVVSRPFSLRTFKRDVFGDDGEKVDVLRMYPSAELLALRSFCEEWNASEFPFTPHITCGPEGTNFEYIPTSVAFDRISMSWGDDRLTFAMTGGYGG